MKTNKNNKRTALIYCRVSSDRQKNEGHGLDSQEQRCRQYASNNGYKIEKVFKESYSGGGDFLRRPAISDLLKHVDNNIHKNYVVIFDDLSRFARDVSNHFKLRQEFDSRDILIKCPNFTFEDTPEGELVETMMAAHHQYHRKNNRRQVIQKQKARLEKGYWAFYPPPGYYFDKDAIHGKLLKKDKLAPIIKEAFEGFESGRFNSQTDVRNFLKSKNFSGRGRDVYLEKVNRLLTRPIYAGLIEYLKWEVERREGYHEAIISVETFDNVQRILRDGRRVMTRKDVSDEFPLRGLVSSVGSNKPYTGSNTKKKNGLVFPYYRDTDKDSQFMGKSFQVKIVDEAMKELFKDIKPVPEVLELTKALVHDEIKKREAGKQSEEHEIDKELRFLEKEKEKLTDRILKTEKESLISIYEERLDKLNLEVKDLIDKKWRNKSELSFGTVFDKVVEYVENPLKQWETGDLKQKRAVVKTVFNGFAEYHPEEGFGTTNLACIYKVFEEIYASKTHHVEIAGQLSNFFRKLKSGPRP